MWSGARRRSFDWPIAHRGELRGKADQSSTTKGTLTDICIDGAQEPSHQDLITPYDLSRCLFDGLAKVSKQIFGEEDLLRLIVNRSYPLFHHPGTNALVERRAASNDTWRFLVAPDAGAASGADEVFDALFSARGSQRWTRRSPVRELEAAAARAVNALASAGAVRFVIAHGGDDRVIHLGRASGACCCASFRSICSAPCPFSIRTRWSRTRRRAPHWTALFNAFSPGNGALPAQRGNISCATPRPSIRC
ncbi:MAG: hypothetical protein IPG43_04680 [Proteobacteria bacterium]|nr:hypothetical protein [Pseudomonadota bacterium]